MGPPLCHTRQPYLRIYQPLLNQFTIISRIHSKPAGNIHNMITMMIDINNTKRHRPHTIQMHRHQRQRQSLRHTIPTHHNCLMSKSIHTIQHRITMHICPRHPNEPSISRFNIQYWPYPHRHQALPMQQHQVTCTMT